jgi:preprotein translocase subunit SecG
LTRWNSSSTVPPAAIVVILVLLVVVILQEVKEHGALALRAPRIILGEHDIHEATGTGS